jgi:hypothetical protein
MASTNDGQNLSNDGQNLSNDGPIRSQQSRLWGSINLVLIY